MSRIPRFRVLSAPWVECNNDTDVFVQVLRTLHWRTPDLFAKLRAHFGTPARAYCAASPQALFRRTPSLADNPVNFRRIIPGWYVDTNNNSERKLCVLMQACAIAGLQPGRDCEIVMRRRAVTREGIEMLLARLKALAARPRPDGPGGAAAGGAQP